MISLKELNPHGYPLDASTAANLAELLERINVVRTAYGKPMTVTSGLRSAADQARINPKAPKSKHLVGCAVDIADADGALWSWCLKNIKILEATGLWLEDRGSTPTWVHFQSRPPGSGKRIFLP